MAKQENLKATVNFGAVVDPSFGAAVSNIGDSLTNAAKDAAYEVNKLSKEQQKLKKRIEEATRAGRDVSKLTARYDELSTSIDQASRKLSRLNALGKAGTYAANVGRIGSAVAKPAIATALMGGGVATALLGGGVGLLGQTAQEAGLAKSYGLDIETYKAQSGIASMAGLNGENFGDLIENMKNVVGEEGNDKAMNQLLAQIGMNKKNVLKGAKINPSKVFSDIMEELTTGVKKGKISAVQAQSLADQLFGGEGNKLVTFMNQMNMGYKEGLKNQEQYNLLTEKGAEGAVRGNAAIGNLWGTAVSGMEEVVGQIVGEMAPDINKAASDLSVWAKTEIPGLVESVTDWLKPEQGEGGLTKLWGAVTEAGENVVKFGQVVGVVADKFSWLLPEMRKVEEMPTAKAAKMRAVELASRAADEQGLSAFSPERRKMVNSAEQSAEDAWYHARNMDVARVANRYTLTGDTGPAPMYGDLNPPDFEPSSEILPPPPLQNAAPVTNNNTTTNNVAPVIHIHPAPGQTAETVQNELKRLWEVPGSPTYDTW